MTFYVKMFKGLLHCDIIMFSENTFQSIIQCRNSETDGEILTTYHFRLDTELVTLISGAIFETVLID